MKIFFDETQKERGKINTNYSMLRDSLRNEGFEVEIYNDFPINKANLKCDVLVFACPDGSKLSKAEVQDVISFVENGGGLLIIGNAGGDRGLRTNMNEVLNQFGIEMLSDQVKDESNNEFNMPTHPVIKKFTEHPTTQGVAEVVIVAGCSVRGSSNMRGIAYSSPVAEPPNTPVVIAGDYKKGRVVAVGSYRLFSNYGAGLSLRNNRTFALNIIRWLARKKGSEPIPQKVEAKVPDVKSIVPPSTKPDPSISSTTVPKAPMAPSSASTVTQPQSKPVTKTVETPSSQPQVTSSTTSTTTTASPGVQQEIERLRSDISEMREIIARLYSDSLGYLQEMKEEVRAMLDYIRTKEG